MEEKKKKIKEFPTSQKPHLRLFCSADIVGSTAFKQQPRTKEAGHFPLWFTVVLGFYQNAEQSFSKNWNLFRKSPSEEDGLSDIFGEPPELWKTVGDEVLFSKRIDHPGQATVCLHAWITTLDELRKQLKEFGNLDVKSTAWIADFPLNNNEVILRQNIGNDQIQDLDDEYPYSNQVSLDEYYSATDKKNLLRDFIGPSIDTGFRLGNFASPRKLILSVELAYIVSTEQSRTDTNKKDYSFGAFTLRKFEFKYDGRHVLKGVLSGSPYPIIWLDLDPGNSIFKTEDEVLNTPRPSATQIQEFSKAFIATHSSQLMLPYIFSDSNIPPEYTNISSDHLDDLIQRHDKFQKGKQKRQSEQEFLPEDTQNTEKNPELVKLQLFESPQKMSGECSEKWP